jgi:uncharacterized membrane protein YphA (DoxX/SURF4 family)
MLALLFLVSATGLLLLAVHGAGPISLDARAGTASGSGVSEALRLRR